MPAISMTSANFRDIVDPILSKVFDGVYEQTQEYAQFVDEVTGIQHRVHFEPIISTDKNAAPIRAEGTATTYMSGRETVNAQYIYNVRSIAFAITQEMQDDGVAINFAKVFTEHAAMTMKEAKEIACADLLNNSQVLTGPDGVTLLSAAHPTPIGLQSNLLPVNAALSYTSIAGLCNVVALTRDDAGRQVGLKAQKLLVPVALQFEAEAVLSSALKAGSANNDINAIAKRGYLPDGVQMITRLASATGFYVKTNARQGLQLVVHPKGKLVKGMEGDFDTDSMRYKMTERYAAGYTNWRTVAGTAGL